MKRLVTAAAIAVLVAGTGTASAATDGPAAHKAPTLGVPHAFGPNSSGWGHVRPHGFFNGGDPSGHVTHIHWSSWGGKVAHGRGKNAIFRPGGGYYARSVTIRLRATDLGRCKPGGPQTYRRLYTSEPSKPGGHPGKWRVWTSYHKNLCTQYH